MNVRPILYHEGQYKAPLSSLMKAAGCKEPVKHSRTSERPEAGVPGAGTVSELCGFFWEAGEEVEAEIPSLPLQSGSIRHQQPDICVLFGD